MDDMPQATPSGVRPTSYDLDGRQSNESLNVSSSYSGCGVSISSVNSRTYDAEGHVTQDVCANAGTGTGVSIPACSPASNFGGTTANLAWGPTGKLRTATNISACDLNGMTIHWDGDRPLFITDSTGALQTSVERSAESSTLARVWRISSSLTATSAARKCPPMIPMATTILGGTVNCIRT